MENFAKVASELVNGKLTINEPLMERSLVCVNDKGVVYNIHAKIRNANPTLMFKVLVKALLTEERERAIENSAACVQVSQNTQRAKLGGVYGCSLLATTDKNGHILSESTVRLTDGKIRNFFKVKKSAPLYALVVEQGKGWENEDVQKHLTAWTEAAMMHMTYGERLDAALAKAAESNLADMGNTEEVATEEVAA